MVDVRTISTLCMGMCGALFDVLYQVPEENGMSRQHELHRSCLTGSVAANDRDNSGDTLKNESKRLQVKKLPLESVSNHTGTGTHLSFVEHQVRRERANSCADESFPCPATHDTSNAPPEFVNATTSPNNEDEVDEEDETSLVPADQERQLILLMLLAQVCALHDPTPRTFTVHVLELFERGILDRQSIRFLYDLGLVPNTTSFNQSLPGTSAPPLLLQSEAEAEVEADRTVEIVENQECGNELAIVDTGNQKRLQLLRQRYWRLPPYALP
jgi:hypothetical protein